MTSTETAAEKGSRPYILRGLSYSVTSILVLLSGYLMNNVLGQPITFLLSIPIGLFTIFFVTYAVCYDYDYSKEGLVYEYDAVAHREAIQYISAFTIAFVIIALLFYVILRGPMPTNHFFVYILLNGLLYISYSTYLYKNFRLAGYPKIRHWLIWPVVISIAVSLYYGRFFSVISTSFEPHFPVLILLFFFLIAEIIRFRQRQFLIASLLGLFILIILTLVQGLSGIWLPPILGVYFPAMLLSILMAAYLAVFEAWRMTAFIASQEFRSDESRSVTLPDSISDIAPSKMTLTKRYYSATLLAHSIAVWLIPFAFIFSDYSLLFIVLFTLHAITSFAVWLIKGKEAKSLANNKYWAYQKIGFGVAFLIIMVIGVKSKFDIQFDKNILIPLFDSFWYLMLSASGYWGALIYKDYQKLQQDEVQNLSKQELEQGKAHDLSGQSNFLTEVIALFSKKINVVRLVGTSCFVACWILLFLYKLPTTTPYVNKFHQAFFCYFIIFLSCCIVELLNITKIYRFPSNFIFAILGILYTLRLPPSFLIGLAIFLPGLSSGLSLEKALLSALPFSLAAMGGFALNDYFDVEKDLINKPYRAIPSRKLRRVHTLVLSVFLLLLSCYSSLLIAGSRLEIFLYLSAVVGVIGYNLVVHYLGVAKSFYTAAISSLPFLYVVLIYEYPSIYLLAPASTLLFISARELLMDIRDIPGDTKSGIRTLPMVIGTSATTNLAFSLKIISLLMLLPFALSPSPVRGTILWLAMIISIIIMYKIWWLQSGRYQRRIIRSLWLTMLLGITLIST